MILANHVIKKSFLFLSVVKLYAYNSLSCERQPACRPKNHKVLVVLHPKYFLLMSKSLMKKKCFQEQYILNNVDQHSFKV